MRLLISELTENHHDTALALIAYAAATGPDSIAVAAPPSCAPLYQSLSEVGDFIPYEGRAAFEELTRKVKAFRPTHIIHVTAYGREPLALAKAFSWVGQIGVLHNLAKLKRFSWIQWQMLRHLRFFWVLRPGLYDRVPKRYKEQSDHLWVGVYPPSLEAQIPPIAFEVGQTPVAIPGRIEYKRRDYRMLLEVLERLRRRERFRFLLLGPTKGVHSDYTDFACQIQEKGWERLFVSFSEMVAFPLYHGYLRASHAVLALIHPHRYSEHKVYKDEQISGAFPMAQAHHKPLLIHKSFADEVDLMDCSLFYHTPQDLAQLLESLADGTLRTDHLYQKGWYSFEEGLRHFQRGLEAV